MAQIEQLFAQGLALHGQGELAKAMQTYEQVLRLAPQHFDALHHVGIVAFQTGNVEMAAGFFRSALAVHPDAGAAHNNLGNALREQQHLEDALLSYERAIALGEGDAWFNRGVALQTLRRWDDALHSYDQALSLNPSDDQAWCNRAAVLQELGQPDAALESVQRALALFPDHAEAHYRLGSLHLASGRSADALACLNRAIELHPQLADAYRQRAAARQQLARDANAALPDRADRASPPIHTADGNADAQRDLDTAAELQRGLADAYCQRGQELFNESRFASAAAMFATALSMEDGDATLWQWQARALNAAKQHTDALRSIDRALALQANSADLHLTRGVILRSLHQTEAARASYEKVVQLAPRHPGGYTNLGSLLDQLGHPQQALDNYERAIALDPNCALAYWNRSLIYLRQGDYARGWRDYEWRCQAETLDLSKKKRGFHQPQCTGCESLQGKTILLHAEQGFGDVLQFCRYAPLVAQRGARVILEAKAPLAALLGSLDGVAQIVIKDAPLPPFDYHIPLMSLPLGFGTTLETIPTSSPYLHADPAKVAAWSDRLAEQAGHVSQTARGGANANTAAAGDTAGGTQASTGTRQKVGVVWAGNPEHLNDHNRSIALPRFARLFDAPCEFISLQKQLSAADQALLDTLPVRQVADQLNDFSDTAALIAALDLVITVDTSVAHLAGALGKKVWILLQAPFEWRWLEQGQHSPWYPSASLFRQPRAGDWDAVLKEVAERLTSA